MSPILDIILKGFTNLCSRRLLSRNDETNILSLFEISMKEVKLLVPELAVLEYMKKIEKYLNRRVIPLKAEVASFANRYMLSIANIKETQASYIEDVRCIHKLCDVVARLPEERRRRNEEKIKTDLLSLALEFLL